MDMDVLLPELLVRGSAWLSFAWYVFAVVGLLRGFPGVLVRWCWTLGCFVFLIHVGLSFHVVHHWSHRSAWEATKEQGGVGEGIYFNYLVIVVWLADVFWWWLRS